MIEAKNGENGSNQTEILTNGHQTAEEEKPKTPIKEEKPKTPIEEPQIPPPNSASARKSSASKSKPNSSSKDSRPITGYGKNRTELEEQGTFRIF